MKTILVTGAAGYIGSHTCLELFEEGFNVIALDNLCNSSSESLNRVQALTGKTLKFYEADILNKASVEKVFEEQTIDAVIHFAGLKAVGESAQIPLAYYENNVNGSVLLAQVMEKYGCQKIVFPV